MIAYLEKIQRICMEVKKGNVYRAEDNPDHEKMTAWFGFSDAESDKFTNDPTCPANDKCPLYQYCAAGRSYGVMEGSYGPTRVTLLKAPSIIPWTAEHLVEIAKIVNEYQYKEA